MRMILMNVVGMLVVSVASSAFAADAPQAGYSCPANMKQVAKVCVTDDQKHAQCLYPAAAGNTPLSGSTQDANPMTCPRHPPH